MKYLVQHLMSLVHSFEMRSKKQRKLSKYQGQKLIKFLFIKFFFGGFFLAGAVSAVFAQAYPNKPVKIIVPFSVATAADIAARQLASRLSEMWGQGVAVENQMGAGGNIGAVNAAKASPDGYTLFMVGVNNVINPSLYKDVGYDVLKDFRPVLRVSSAPLAIVVHPSFPANNIAELVALAKAKPNSIVYGSGGNGSVTHLSIELLKSQTGIVMTHVPYKGIAQMMADIMGNQIPMGSPAAASALPQAKSGKVKILAVTSIKRSSQLPDTPTVAESGVPGFDVSAWNGILVPSKTPDDVVNKLQADIAKVVQNKDFIEALQKQGLENDLLGPVEFKNFIGSELSKWAKLVKDSGAKLD
ncbi:MAG: tripartite tricarboxylate transporter substrate binding protein [Limnohabitans sp.]|nr:tripartite tricarboxylate transporter substrate binding protein [Limnohabitans sp.]